MEKRSWKFRRYSWKYWRVCFGITAERDRRTRGWRFGIRCIPLFCLMWTYRVPSWNGWYELETSFVVSLLPVRLTTESLGNHATISMIPFHGVCKQKPALRPYGFHKQCIHTQLFSHGPEFRSANDNLLRGLFQKRSGSRHFTRLFL